MHDNAVVWARVRERGLEGGDLSLAYYRMVRGPKLKGPDR